MANCMHMVSKPVRLREEAKKSLDRLKKDFKFTNYSNCITTIETFFKNNNISPRDSINNSLLRAKLEIKSEIENLKDKMQNFENWVKEDSKTLRKWHGKWVQDYFITTIRDVEEVKNFILTGNEVKKSTFLKKEPEPTVQDEDEILKLRRDNELFYQRSKESAKIIEGQEQIFKEYKNQLNKIKINLSYQKTQFGKTKIILDLEPEEVEKIWETIRNL